MFTLLTTVISFLSGGVPKLLDFFQNRSDNKHEIQMAQLRELHEQLQGNHDKLRSKIWGYIGGNNTPEPRTAREGRTADFITPGETHADILARRARARSS